MSHQRYTLHGLRGGGATDHWLQYLGALPSPLGDVGRKQRTCRRRTRYEHRHTGMDDVVSRVRRSRLGAAVTLVYCGSLASVHSHTPANASRVSVSCSTLLHMLSFWLESASTVLRACCQLFDCSCRSDHVVVDWSCWKPNCLISLVNGFALQPAFLFSTCDPDT